MKEVIDFDRAKAIVNKKFPWVRPIPVGSNSGVRLENRQPLSEEHKYVADAYIEAATNIVNGKL